MAFDASEAMVLRARARVGDRAAVRRMRFEDLAWKDLAWSEAFDGVWACASLLHVPRASFPAVAARLAGALKPGGTWYMSFKLGEAERVDGGRLFVDHIEATLRRAVARQPVDLVETWVSADLRPGRGNGHWLNAVAISRAGLVGVTSARS